MLSYIRPVKVPTLMVAGKDNFLQIRCDADHNLKIGQRTLVEVFDDLEIVITIDDSVGQVGQWIFSAKIGDHGALPGARADYLKPTNRLRDWRGLSNSTDRNGRTQFELPATTECRLFDDREEFSV